MTASRLTRNAAGTGVRLLLSALLMMALGRYLLDQLGAEMLGVWVLVLATAAAGSAGTLGMGGTLLRFVAASPRAGERRAMLLHTAVISAAALLLLAGLALLAAGPALLSIALPEGLLTVGTGLLPIALAAFWMSGVGGVYQSFCEGLQRYDVTNAILLAGGALHLGLCVLLVPAQGIRGAALAHLGQAALVCAALAGACRLLPGGVSPLPRRWTRRVFRELLPYGARLQVMSLLGSLHDTVMKYLVGLFGAVGQAAYYDLAARLASTLRQMVVGPAVTLVPAFAELQGARETEGRTLRLRAEGFMLTAGALIVLAPGAMAGFVSTLWLGAPISDFMLALTLLSIGWYVNAVSAPSYFALVGRGELDIPLASHFAAAGCAAGFGVLGGTLWGFPAVAAASGLSIGVGAAVTLVQYRRRYPGAPPAVGGRSMAGTLRLAVAYLAGGTVLFQVLSGRVSTPLLLAVGAFFSAGMTAGILATGTGREVLEHLRRVSPGPPLWVSRMIFRLAYSNKFPFLSFARHGALLDAHRAAVAARHGLIDATISGMRFALDIRHAVDLLCWIGRFEPAQTRLLKTIVRPGSTVVDAGANIGYYTLLCARWTGPAGRVIAFEPSPAPAARLETGVRHNGLMHVRVRRQALAAGEGEAVLRITSDPGFSSLGHPSTRSPVVEEIAVPTVSLDRVCREEGIERIHVLTMDVEGSELPALQGARRMLADGRIDVIVVEYNREIQMRCGFDPDALPAELRRHGFSVEIIGPRGLLPFPREGIAYAELYCRRRGGDRQ